MVTIWVGVAINKISDLTPKSLDDDLWLWIGLTTAVCFAVISLGVVVDRRMRSEGDPGPIFDVPPLDAWVPRPELDETVRALLRKRSGGEVALTTALHGAGGFGKTTLAKAVARNEDVRRRFPGGIIWLTIGRDVAGARLAELIRAPIRRLGGTTDAEDNPEQAGLGLADALKACGPCLLVLDDVWTAAQLLPFRQGEADHTLLITTRNRKILLRGSENAAINVDQLKQPAAARLLSLDLHGLPSAELDELLDLTGRWPLLLSLVNAALNERVSFGTDPAEAAAEVIARLRSGGPAALDVDDADSRSEAVRATIDYALATTPPAMLSRFLELGVFAEDAAVPLDVVAALWSGTGGLDRATSDDWCRELANRSLIRLADAQLELHDVIRDFARAELGPEELGAAHQALVDNLRGAPWWEVAAEPGYLLRHLAHHMDAAGLAGELATLVTDPRWLDLKIRAFGAAAIEADLALAETPHAADLARLISQNASLFQPVQPGEPASVVTSALLAWLREFVPASVPAVTAFEAELDVPLLTCTWPIPDRLPSRLIRELPGHASTVTGIDFSPDGTWLVSAAQDGTVHRRTTDGHDLGRTSIGPGVSWPSVRVAPKGDWVLLADNNGRLHIWALGDERPSPLNDPLIPAKAVAIAPDGTWLAVTEPTGRVLLFGSDGTPLGRLRGRTGGVIGVAISPAEPWLLTLDAAGAICKWGKDGRRQEVLRRGGSRLRNTRYVADRTREVLRDAPYTSGTHRIAHHLRRRRLLLSAARIRDWPATFLGLGILWSVSPTFRASAPTGLRLGSIVGQKLGEQLARTVNPIALPPDGQVIVACTEDRQVRLFTAAGAEQRILADDTDADCELVFVSSDTLLEVSMLQNIMHPEQHIEHFAFQLGGRRRKLFWTRGPALHIRTSISDMRDLSKTKIFPIAESVLSDFTLAQLPYAALATSPSGDIIALPSGNRVGLWRLVADPARPSGGPWTATARAASLSPDATRLAYTRDGRVWLGDRTGSAGEILEFSSTGMPASFAPDGSWLIAATQGGLGIWEADGTLRAELQAQTTATIAPDGTWLATVEDRSPRSRPHSDMGIRLWNADGTMYLTMDSLNKPADVLIAPDSECFAITYGREVGMWTRRGERMTTFAVPAKYKEQVKAVFAPDASWLAAWTAGQFVLCDRSGEITVLIKKWGPTGIAIAPNSSWFALAVGYSTYLIDLETPEAGRRGILGGEPVITGDGSAVLTRSSDGHRAWLHATDGSLLRAFDGPPGWAARLALSPSEELLAGMGKDGTVRIADVNTGRFLTGIRARDELRAFTWFPDGSGVHGTGAHGLYGFALRQPPG